MRETIPPREGTETIIATGFILFKREKQPTPRKGTETAPARFPCLSYAMKQPTPRKGTETSGLSSRTWGRGNDSRPVRGRKLLGQRDEAVGVGNTLHLARGRKHILACPFVNLHLKHFTPRQGTETCLPPSRQKSSGETLYTPQGDGNSHHSGRMLIKTGNNPHPARGRKLPPRRQLGQHDLGNNPHPARGRKLITPVQLAKFMKEILYTPPGDN